jgi:uncharacterized repeat protein (TIGR04076 family)
MGNAYDVSIQVISKKGLCPEGHEVGDKWIVRDGKIPGGICHSAFISFGSDLRVLRYGGCFPWRTDPDTAQAACPDAANPVVFALKRLKED